MSIQRAESSLAGVGYDQDPSSAAGDQAPQETAAVPHAPQDSTGSQLEDLIGGMFDSLGSTSKSSAPVSPGQEQPGKAAQPAKPAKKESLGEKIKDGFKDLGKDIKKGADDLGKDIKKGADDLGKDIKKGADDLGKDIKKGADDLGKDIKKDAKKIGDALLTGFSDFEHAASQVGAFIGDLHIPLFSQVASAGSVAAEAWADGADVAKTALDGGNVKQAEKQAGLDVAETAAGSLSEIPGAKQAIKGAVDIGTRVGKQAIKKGLEEGAKSTVDGSSSDSSGS